MDLKETRCSDLEQVYILKASITWIAFKDSVRNTHKYAPSRLHEDRHCGYNVTWTLVREIIVAAGKTIIIITYSECICSSWYPACNAQRPCCYHIL